MRWADSHCHLPYEGIEDVAAAVADAQAAGVERMISVGTDAARSAAAVAASREYPGTVWATAGLHPHDASQGLDALVALLDSEGDDAFVAIGECGLDYHYDHSPRDVQRRVFAEQVVLARQRGLALVIHTRDAWDDTFAVLAAEGVPDRTVFHCFTGGEAEARRALDTGAWLSFSGIVSFKTADDVRGAARLCPLDRLLVETDAPYLAPMPHRGKPNRPAWLPAVAAAVADAKGLPLDAVAEATWVSTATAFGLPPG